jgi:Ca-activated chloride channel family protein
MIELLDRWDEQRKPARVELLVDVSGSMGDPASGDSGPTKLDLAIQAATNALDQFASRDVVGLRVFSTELGPTASDEVLELVTPAPMTAAHVSDLREEIGGLFPTNATPLYTAVQSTYNAAVGAYDPESINAIVLLSDGVNDDGEDGDDDQQLDALLDDLTAGSEGGRSRPVRVFAIAYGEQADVARLRQIAEASDAALYVASDAATIDRVLAAVISNF